MKPENNLLNAISALDNLINVCEALQSMTELYGKAGYDFLNPAFDPAVFPTSGASGAIPQIVPMMNSIEDCANESDETRETCEYCGRLIYGTEKAIEVYVSYHRAKIACAHCCRTEENLQKCQDCGEWYNSDTYGNGTYCEACAENYYTCSHCGGFVHNDDIYTCQNSDEPYCERCFFRLHSRCADCGKYFPNDDLTCIDDDYYCESCAENHNEKDWTADRIFEHDYKPEPVFFRVKNNTKTNRFFGFELETESNGNSLHGNIFRNRPENVYYKKDGSLDHGAEIVSHPCTKSYLNSEKFRLSFARYLDGLKSAGFASYDTTTCGLHWHVSKDSISALTLYKLMCLFLDNENHLIRFSRRGSKENLNRWSAPYRQAKIDRVKRGNNCGLQRYQAINLANRNTIEFRFFKGTLNFNVFMATWQALNAAMDYCEKTALNSLNFMDFIRSIDKKEYPEAYVYFRKRFKIACAKKRIKKSVIAKKPELSEIIRKDAEKFELIEA